MLKEDHLETTCICNAVRTDRGGTSRARKGQRERETERERETDTPGLEISPIYYEQF